MAKVTKITATFEGLIPTQQYANVKISGAFEIELAPGDDPAQVLRDYIELGKAEVARQATLIAAGKKRSIEKLSSMLYAGEYGASLEIIKSQLPILHWLQVVDAEGEIIKRTVEQDLHYETIQNEA